MSVIVCLRICIFLYSGPIIISLIAYNIVFDGDRPLFYLCINMEVMFLQVTGSVVFTEVTFCTL